jgi:hypothetical protein
MNIEGDASGDGSARQALAAHEGIAHHLRKIKDLVRLRGQALREAHAAGVAWAELARRFGVHPSRIIELAKR